MISDGSDDEGVVAFACHESAAFGAFPLVSQAPKDKILIFRVVRVICQELEAVLDVHRIEP